MQGILLLPPQGMLGQLKVGIHDRDKFRGMHHVDAMCDITISRATHHP